MKKLSPTIDRQKRYCNWYNTQKDHEELETFTVTKKKFYAGGVVVDSGTGKD